jgi:hypothetical protein
MDGEQVEQSEQKKQRSRKRQKMSSRGREEAAAAAFMPEKKQARESLGDKSVKKYFLRRDPADFTVSFYERFDEMFVYNQAVTLKYAIDQGEAFRGVLNLHLVQLLISAMTSKHGRLQRKPQGRVRIRQV